MSRIEWRVIPGPAAYRRRVYREEGFVGWSIRVRGIASGCRRVFFRVGPFGLGVTW